MRALQRIMKQENESGTWILKPTKGLQGIGIVLARTFAQVEQTLQSNDDKVYSVQRSGVRFVAAPVSDVAGGRPQVH